MGTWAHAQQSAFSGGGGEGKLTRFSLLPWPQLTSQRKGPAYWLSFTREVTMRCKAPGACRELQALVSSWQLYYPIEFSCYFR